MEKRHNYVRKVAETAVQLFITNDKVGYCVIHGNYSVCLSLHLSSTRVYVFLSYLSVICRTCLLVCHL